MQTQTRDWLSREVLERHSVDMRQFIDFRLVTLANGMRAVEAYNSSGLTFTVLLDRGLDIWTAHYNGLPLTWISQGSPYPADFGQSWLQQVNGGLLFTCGLTHVGPPEADPETGEFRDLHGRFNRLRAGDVNITRGWVGDRYEIAMTATVHEFQFFGVQLRLERTMSMVLGEPAVEIRDRISNASDGALPFMLLYHFNVGYPLVREGTELVTPHAAVLARDDDARAGLAQWAQYDGPVAGYPEQVFFHHLKSAAGAGSNVTEIALLNDDFGLSLSWDVGNLPYFTQWKNTREGLYICGIEPGNCIPEGQQSAREHDRLQILSPGEEVLTFCALSVLDDPISVEECRARVESMQQTGRLVPDCKLDDYVSE